MLSSLKLAYSKKPPCASSERHLYAYFNQCVVNGNINFHLVLGILKGVPWIIIFNCASSCSNVIIKKQSAGATIRTIYFLNNLTLYIDLNQELNC